ncbi:heme NO-binding domain-containing protein [Thaumasiovibrio subtropicus]|uniref:heme NO-binding domain-containing protein n=1 Tax=Thaumasiovibrio subtropicus TaxID=1891207 RepID=UPI000B35BCA3|nr:heme NO-binding domain-containing protein [Thaumasiovibrio subtropicus]
MKGMIFTEFLELVEDKFGLAIYDKMLENAGDEGIYTSVGSYDHLNLVKLIVELSKLTDVSVDTLQEVFGEAVFDTLYNSMPLDEISNTDTFSFLQAVEAYIHKEVIKLYPDAVPPRFEFHHIDSNKMVMDYYSSRCMGSVCLGLIRGCANHFNETVDISMLAIDGKQDHIQFEIHKR